MGTSTQIVSIDSADFELPLRAPFGIANGVTETARNLLVSVTLENGIVGYGEAAPLEHFNGESLDSTRAAIGQAAPAIVGRRPREWRRIARDIAAAIPAAGAARCALETAILDAHTRSQGVSIWRYLGAARRVLRTDITIPLGSIAEASAAASDAAARGFSTLKIKVGADVARDAERIAAVRAAAPQSALLLDANGGYTVDAALALLADLKARGIRAQVFEQPVPRGDIEGLARIRRDGRVAVAADESAASSADVSRLVKARAIDVVNIKLMKCGLNEAMDMAWLAQEAGVKLMIGGLVESILAMTVSACFAAGTGGYAFVDLDMPLLCAAQPLRGGMSYEGDALKFTHIKLGHGVAPKPADSDA